MPKYAMIEPEPPDPARPDPADAQQRLSLSSCAHSEIGPVRKNNQDSAYVSPTMVVVADGMGGAAAGDVASTVAILELRRSDGHFEGEHMLEAIAGAMVRANDRIADLIAHHHDLDGMGTTVSGALFSGNQLGLVHIGDSRGYLLRDGNLTRLTHDHSWVQSLVDDGKITEAEAAVHPHRSLLLKVLNGQPTHEPDYSIVDLAKGDRLLFCSDGLCGLVDDRQIRRTLRGSDAESAMQSLVDAAYAAGGYDNITVIISDVVEADATLDAKEPMTLGAAATVTVPKTSSSPVGAPDPSQPAPATASLTAGAPAADRADTNPPEGLIDPDAHEDVRYTPTMIRSRRRWPVVVSVAGALVLLVAGVLGAWRYATSQYYLAPSAERIGIWQGLPDTIAGKSLGRLVEQRDTKVSDLPAYYAQEVRSASFSAGSLDQARSQADYLDRLARACIQARAEHPAPAPGSPSPAASPTATGPAPPLTSPAPAATTSASLATGPRSIPITGSVSPQDCS
ncbi:protein phosphatase [Propionibacterium cyclohexanicum]|uniref:Protein phosphatase n=1 Tax=Propionibacterium cyclohexanicum TaxID=64702 RepID=A0A1H9T049_9ACTN|nr:protein phosphatase 2C domain-containing protein [Propionibacterium cyclohexanicum]SER90394.1 protein phosphatase [Propionibacterium cyclohexanicum]